MEPILGFASAINKSIILSEMLKNYNIKTLQMFFYLY